MNIVQVFIGCKCYPLGGAEDLRCTLFNQEVPSEQQLCEMLRQCVARDPNTGNDSFWLNVCVTGDDKSVRIERWLGFTTKAGHAPWGAEAPYVTAYVEADGERYSLVAIEKRRREGAEYDYFGPKGHPEVAFF